MRKYNILQGLKNVLSCGTILSFFLATGFADSKNLFPTIALFCFGLICGILSFIANACSLYFRNKAYEKFW